MRFLKNLFKKKVYNAESLANTNLNRVLSLFDITSLGIAFTVAGIYILGGDIILNYGGPAVILSFLIAGIANLLAALCYAELGSRVPRSGSAYVYIYVTIGEVVAFIMGWDLMLEYIIGVASIGSSLSQNIDALVDFKIKTAIKEVLPMNVQHFNSYADVFGMMIVFVTSGLMIFGIKESAGANKLVTTFNLLIILFIIILGSTKINTSNWALNFDSSNNFTNSTTSHLCTAPNSKKGNGGFLPFGIEGVISGSAACFYAYTGFDVISATGEEVKNPKVTIPRAILLSFVIVSIAYFGVSAVITLMMPYCMVDFYAPIPVAFEYVGLSWAKYIVSVGTILTIFACLFAGLYPMSRIVYSMASDGLILKVFAKVNSKFHTPHWAILITGFFSGILTLLLDLNQLIEMVSIGTLWAYTIVSICVILLRYKPTAVEDDDELKIKEISDSKKCCLFSSELYEIFIKKHNKCTNKTSIYVNIFTFLTITCITGTCVLIRLTKIYSTPLFISIFTILMILMFICIFALWKQPQNKDIDSFKVPLLPFIPLIGITINIYLLLTLAWVTWVRFMAWFFIGLVVYFTYGIRNSHEQKKLNKIASTINEKQTNNNYEYLEKDTETKVTDEFSIYSIQDDKKIKSKGVHYF